MSRIGSLVESKMRGVDTRLQAVEQVMMRIIVPSLERGARKARDGPRQG